MLTNVTMVLKHVKETQIEIVSSPSTNVANPIASLYLKRGRDIGILYHLLGSSVQWRLVCVRRRCHAFARSPNGEFSRLNLVWLSRLDALWSACQKHVLIPDLIDLPRVKSECLAMKISAN